MERIVLDSGNALNFGIAPINVSYKLFQKVIIAFKKNGIDIKIDRDTDLNIVSLIESNSGAFLAGLADIITSDEVMQAIMDCAVKCNYETQSGKQKINMEVFEENRADMFPVLREIALRNLKPFFQKAPTE